MLKANYPKIENKKFTDLESNLVEPSYKINIRGKNREFFTKIGKVLSLMLPTESNTCSTIKNINALWLSPDEWLVYGRELNKNIEIMLQNEISKVNLGSVTNVSDQWMIINMKGKNVFNLLTKASPFNFNEFKNKENVVVQTLFNHIDVILHHQNINDLNLFVRKSFSEHLLLWIYDSSRLM